LAYDAVDNLVKVTDALGNTVQTQYDALNNPRQVTDALGRSTTFAYDAVNRLTQRQDALKRITTFEYDNVDRLIASVDALTGRSSQAFDADGNRTALVDPNHHQTQFEFDCKGRLEAEISSAGGRQAYGYNARDLLTEITNARKQTRHIEYDALGQMTQISDADGPIHYGYDKNGNVLTITDDNGTISREYDALNRVIKYTDSQGNTLHYAYNEVGNLVTLTYPDNRQVHYDYDDANQLIQITDWAQRETHYEWDDNGRLIKETRPNGTVMTRRYDKAGQLLQQQDVSASGEVIAQFEFSYDPVGNITNETPALKPPLVDATLTYTDANQLDTYNGQAVQFDADGNMIKGPLNGAMQPFQFDSRNRLYQIADTRYVYNAENQRIAVKNQGKITHYVINPQAALSQVLVKTAPDGTATYYVYGLGLIGEETNGAYQAYHYDLRGSTVALTDASGTVVDRYQYSAFAQLVNHEGSSDTPFLYNGRDGVMSDTNGLYYMRARYYSPEIRRFVNQDVLLGNVADGQSLNRYAYVTGNPVSYVDPFGYYGLLSSAVTLGNAAMAGYSLYKSYSANSNSNSSYGSTQPSTSSSNPVVTPYTNTGYSYNNPAVTPYTNTGYSYSSPVVIPTNSSYSYNKKPADYVAEANQLPESFQLTKTYNSYFLEKYETPSEAWSAAYQARKHGTHRVENGSPQKVPPMQTNLSLRNSEHFLFSYSEVSEAPWKAPIMRGLGYGWSGWKVARYLYDENLTTKPSISECYWNQAGVTAALSPSLRPSLFYFDPNVDTSIPVEQIR